MAKARHVIDVTFDLDTDRAYWECGDCGRSGSCVSWDVDIHAEKHVRAGESVAYRYPPRADL